MEQCGWHARGSRTLRNQSILLPWYWQSSSWIGVSWQGDALPWWRLGPGIAEMVQQAVVERGDGWWNGSGLKDDFGEVEVFVALHKMFKASNTFLFSHILHGVCLSMPRRIYCVFERAVNDPALAVTVTFLLLYGGLMWPDSLTTAQLYVPTQCLSIFLIGTWSHTLLLTPSKTSLP